MQHNLNYSLRDALPSDYEFLAILYATTRSDELDRASFPLDQRATFCRMQFEAQQRHYRMYFARASDQIVMLNNQVIGRILIARAPDEIFLVDIALMPEYRNRGIGTDLVTRLKVATNTFTPLPFVCGTKNKSKSPNFG